MIERIRKFLHRASTDHGMASAATAHVCVHPCPEHIAMALVFWMVGLFISLKGGPSA